MNLNRPLLRASWAAWISNEPGRGGGPWWLAWVWTLLFAAALAVPFTVFGFWAFGSGEGAWRNWAGWAYWYGKNFVVCLTVAATIHLLFDLGRSVFASPERVAGWRPWQRSTYFGGVPIIGMLLGWPLGVTLAGANVLEWLNSREGMNLVVGSGLVSLILTFLMHQYFASRHREVEAERRATEARLRLLQAQIEPHFLFNTLANVHSLMDHDLPKAKRMLADFSDYLRASLGTLRGENSTVAQELDLARGYLQLLQGRMEERLRFDITASDVAAAQPLAPLLLQPLVENAVVHGLESSIEGGRIHVSARTEGAQLVLEVRDDGRGLDAPPRAGTRQGHGMALANIRQRLHTRYGAGARLEVLPAHPGTLARITLPLPLPTP